MRWLLRIYLTSPSILIRFFCCRFKHSNTSLLTDPLFSFTAFPSIYVSRFSQAQQLRTTNIFLFRSGVFQCFKRELLLSRYPCKKSFSKQFMRLNPRRRIDLSWWGLYLELHWNQDGLLLESELSCHRLSKVPKPTAAKVKIRHVQQGESEKLIFHNFIVPLSFLCFVTFNRPFDS